ncbi:unnamed protein product [Linum tenue]|uniref:Uncharacterized protein n=1 Tax=Linum tenue TaxID=586396 RepID=A0AAV0I606_9ROSI|nr:unnamed protein product [Linum tenue]
MRGASSGAMRLLDLGRREEVRAGELRGQKGHGELPMQDIGSGGGRHEVMDRDGGMHQRLRRRQKRRRDLF